MKGKLIKTGKLYVLAVDDIIATTDDYLNTKLGYLYRLSLKNCEAIKNGYNLDELSKEDADLRYNKPGEEDLWLTRVTGIEYGFNLALELLADKKFSKDDMKKAFEKGALKLGNNRYFDELIQSLQKTEWDVEVVMDRIPADLAPGGWDVFPKLDAENCLILKRVE